MSSYSRTSSSSRRRNQSVESTDNDSALTGKVALNLLIGAIVVALVGVLVYILMLALKNRRMYQSTTSPSSLPPSSIVPTQDGWDDAAAAARQNNMRVQSEQPNAGGLNDNVRSNVGRISSLRPGDLLFVRQRPLKAQFSRLFISPRNVITGFLTGLPCADHLPSHVSMVLAPHEDWTQFEILDINSTTNEPCVTTLHQYLNAYPNAYYTVHFGVLSRSIPHQCIEKIRSTLAGAKVTYGTKIIIKHILPRSTEQFVDRRLLQYGRFYADPNQRFASIARHHSNQLVSVLPLPLISRRWKGLQSNQHTCSSLVYAALESCGMVAPFFNNSDNDTHLNVEKIYANESSASTTSTRVWSSRHVTPLKTSPARDLQRLDKQEGELVRVIEPFAVLPADFLVNDFQWLDDTRVMQYGDVRELLRNSQEHV